jgi:hypothetical protein
VHDRQYSDMPCPLQCLLRVTYNVAIYGPNGRTDQLTDRSANGHSYRYSYRCPFGQPDSVADSDLQLRN